MRPSSKGVMPRGPSDAAVGSGPPNPALVIGVGAARRNAESLPGGSPPLEPGRLRGAFLTPGGRLEKVSSAPVSDTRRAPASDTFRGGDGAAPSASRP